MHSFLEIIFKKLHFEQKNYNYLPQEFDFNLQNLAHVFW